MSTPGGEPLDEGTHPIGEPTHETLSDNSGNILIQRAIYLTERIELASRLPPEYEEYEADRKKTSDALREIESSLTEIESLLDNQETFRFMFNAISTLASSENTQATHIGLSILEEHIPVICQNAVQSDDALSTVLSGIIWWTRFDEPSRLESIGYDITELLTDQLTQKIIDGDVTIASLAAKSLYDYCLHTQQDSEDHTMPSKSKADIAIGIVADNSAVILDNILKADGSDEREQYSNAFKIMLLSSDTHKKESVVTQLVGTVIRASETDIGRVSELIGDIRLSAGIVERILSHYAFPTKNIRNVLSAWNDNSDNTERDMSHIIAGNIATIHYLENRHEGSAFTLYDEFNIRNFCRWPKKLLAKQYERRDDTSRPYWVMFKPEGDEAGIFNKIDADTDFFNAVTDVIDIIAMEVGDYGWTFEDVHRKLHDRYGGKRKISGGIWGAHGKADYMGFGLYGTDRLSQTPDTRDANDWDFIRSCYVPHPTIVLKSCLVGVENGAAQFLSGTDRMQAKIIASSISFGNMSFDGEILPHADGSIDMQVVFDNGFRNVFDRGELVPEESIV